MIINKVLAAGMLATILTACSPQPEWMLLGDINGLDRAQWSAATSQQQLGTAAYWLLALERKGWLSDPELVMGDKFKPASMILKDCINNYLSFSSKETNTLVAECVQINNWAK